MGEILGAHWLRRHHVLCVMPAHLGVADAGRMTLEPAPTRPVLFINPRSGGGAAARAGLVEKASALGILAVVLEPEGDLDALVREAIAAGADALGMAGGDGSMATVAAAASAHGLPFVCVPAGTRNHFARDLGVARHGPVDALAAFTTGVERQIDMADVNGQAFVNNVSIGVYGDAVQRAAYRGAKLRTLLETAHEVLGPGASAPRMQVVDDLGRDHTHPAVLLVSNNPYTREPPAAPGTRRRLDAGRLGVVILDSPDEPAGRAPRAWTAARLNVDADATIHAGRDGEPVTLEPPLRFTTRPGALRVLSIQTKGRP
jgi:diacylglycerol kinase family enzyme